MQATPFASINSTERRAEKSEEMKIPKDSINFYLFFVPHRLVSTEVTAYPYVQLSVTKTLPQSLYISFV